MYCTIAYSTLGFFSDCASWMLLKLAPRAAVAGPRSELAAKVLPPSMDFMMPTVLTQA